MTSLSRIGIESYMACIFYDVSAVFAIFCLDTAKSKLLGSFFLGKVSGPKEAI